MNLLLLALLVLPFACLAALSFVAFLGVAAIGGTLSVIGMATSILGFAGRKDNDPWRDTVGDAHPLDHVEVPDSDQINCEVRSIVGATGRPR